MSNGQPISKVSMSDQLNIHSVFNTIQGEGHWAGTPALFIRLAGCNLSCKLCDTEYTQGSRMISIPDFCKELQEVKTIGDLGNLAVRHIVITGGEPWRQPVALMALITRLANKTIFPNLTCVEIETNFTQPFHAWDCTAPFFENEDGKLNKKTVPFEVWITASPKTRTAGMTTAWEYVDQVKYTVDQSTSFCEDTGLPNLILGSYGTHHPPDNWLHDNKSFVFLQPAHTPNDSRNAVNRDIAIYYCNKYGYRLSVQTHKLIGLP